MAASQQHCGPDCTAHAVTVGQHAVLAMNTLRIVSQSVTPAPTAIRRRGLTDLIRGHALHPGQVELAWNPEFLRESHAIDDTLRPDRLVIGCGYLDATHAACMAELGHEKSWPRRLWRTSTGN